MSGLDSGDTATFAIVIENTGSGASGAYDVTVRDTLPAGMEYVDDSLCVTDGAGAPLIYSGTDNDLFTGAGIRLDDPESGALRPYNPDDGANLAVLTFDARLTSTAPVAGILVNNAALTNYTNTEGGTDFTAVDLTDAAQLTTRDPASAKSLTGTEIVNTANSSTEAVNGEFVDYQITLSLPEGTLPAAQVIDTLDNPLGYVSCLEIVTSPGVTTDLPGGFADACSASNPAYNAGSRVITYNLGTLTNTNNDNAVTETIQIRYRAVVRSGANAGTQLNNSAVLSWTGGSLGAVMAPNVIVRHPGLTLDKNLNPLGGANWQGGQAVSYTLVITQAAGASQVDAYDVTLSDPLPKTALDSSSLILSPTIASVTDSASTLTPANFSLVGSNATGWTLQTAAPVDMPATAARTVSIVLNGTLSNLVQAGETIPNTGTLTWTSLDGEPGQRSTHHTDSTERSFSDPGAVNATAASLVPVKTILSTNQDHTAGLNVAVGEQVRYQLTITVPDGIARNLIVTDVLDTGLAFVSCDSVSASPSLAASAPGGFACPASPFSANPAGVVPQNQARQMTIGFGDVTNSDTDPATAETITMEYTAVVLNGAAVTTGVDRRNTASLTWTGGTASANAPYLNVVQPSLTVGKTVSPEAADAGDTITYTVTVTSAGGADNAGAFEAAWSDRLPASLSYVTGSLRQVSGPPVSLSEAAPDLAAAWASFPAGQTAVLEYQADLLPAVIPGQSIVNAAAVQWSSLPGDETAPQTANNALSCERTGSAAQACGGALNSYRAQDTAPLDVSPQGLGKELIATSLADTSDPDITIGEIATYLLTVTLPESEMASLTVADELPAGMEYVPGSAVVDDAALNGSLPDPTITAPGGSGGDVTFAFGSTTVTPDNDPANNTFTITLQARVLDLPASRGTAPRTNLSNRATIQVESGAAVPSDPVVLTVAEPRLTLAKEILPASAALNDPISVTLTVQNTGTSPAYDVVISDPLPAGIFRAITEGTTPAGWTYSLAGETVTYTGAQLNPGETVSFTFTAVVDAISAGQILTNTATATQATTLPGTDAGERDEPDVPASDTLVGLAPDLSIQKDDGVVSAEPGETLIYTLTISNLGANAAPASGVVVTETVPTYTTYTGSGWTCTPDASAGSTCTYPVGLLAAGASISVPFQVAVLDSLPADAETIVNTASVTDDGTHGADTDPENNSDSDTDNLGGEPLVAGLKSAELVEDLNGDGQVNPGEELRYTILVTNTGDRTALGVALQDSPDPLTELVVGSVTTTQGSVARGNTSGDTDVLVELGELPGLTGSATVNFRVRVLPLPSFATEVFNQGVVSGENISETFTNEVITPLSAAPDLWVTKTDGGASAAAGEVVAYTIEFGNSGDQDAPAAVLTETVPDHALFDAAGSDPAWMCADGAPAGTACTLDLPGPILSGARDSLTFAVRAVSPLPAGAEQLANTVTITLVGQDPESNLTNNTDSDTTPLSSAPDLAITKTDGGVSSGPGETLVYTLSYENKGAQDATGVTVRETVPAHTRFDAAASLPAVWSCAGGSPAGTVCTLDLGSLAVGASGTLSFGLTVDSPLPAGAAAVENTASISDDGANGTDPTPADNTASDTTPLAAAPDLAVSKDDGVSQTAPGAELTYSLTVRNNGTRGASGVALVDTLPEHLEFVSASDGGEWNETTRTVTWPVFDLAAGAAAARTLAVRVSETVPPETGTLVNQAHVSDDGTNGTDPTPSDNETTDTDTLAAGGKQISATSASFTTLPAVAVGEKVTYEITLDVAPGALDSLILSDVLPRGLAFAGCAVSSAPGLTADPAALENLCAGSGIFSAEPAGSSAPEGAARRLTLNFGRLTNPGPDDGWVTVTVETVVLNSAGNTRGSTLTNTAEWTWTGGSQAVSAPPVRVAEPGLTLSKNVASGIVLNGNLVEYRVTVQPAQGSNAPAFDVTLTDRLPTYLVYMPGSLRVVSGPQPDALDENGAPVLSASWSRLDPDDEPVVLAYTARVSGAPAGRPLTNTAEIRWSSLPGSVSGPQTPLNPLSNERSYQPGSTVDVYGASASVSLEVPVIELPNTGFPPGLVSLLPEQRPEDAYTALTGLRIEIPALGLDLSLAGVPLDEDGWDLTWLGGQAGYLEGTAFPTWAGNSGITAHATGPDGRPGPFAGLSRLRYDDQIIIHAFGEQYIYQVRAVERVKPGNLAPLRHEERSWLTLLSCQGYNPGTGGYDWRTAVRAVLVEVRAP